VRTRLVRGLCALLVGVVAAGGITTAATAAPTPQNAVQAPTDWAKQLDLLIRSIAARDHITYAQAAHNFGVFLASINDRPGVCESYHDNALMAGWPESQWAHVKRIMHRESNCYPYRAPGGKLVRTFCCFGLLQVYAKLHYRGPASDLYNPNVNLAVAARMWRASGWGPWAL